MPTRDQILTMQAIIRESGRDCAMQYVTKVGHLIFALRGYGLVMVTLDNRVITDVPV